MPFIPQLLRGAQEAKGGHTLPQVTLIRPNISEVFENFITHERVLFLSASCGFGKSAVASALLSKKNVLSLSAASAGFFLPSVDGSWEILMIDDLQNMQDEADWQTLCELIRNSPNRRFVLLSRGSPPGCLMAFQFSGLMTVLTGENLCYDCNDIKNLFVLHGLEPRVADITSVFEAFHGYPLATVAVLKLAASGRNIDSGLIAQVSREVLLYFESNIYYRFDLPLRRFLLDLVPFDSFDAEMTRIISGNPRAGELLEWLQRNTSVLRYDDIGHLRFWEPFRNFLFWEMEREYTAEKRTALFNRGGLYYELKEDFPRALECYAKSGDHSRISELLIRNAELHPGMMHYNETEKYYRALPEKEILDSPSLMKGMSILCALETDYEGSERWYQALKSFAESRSRHDAAGRQARNRLTWLDISLPQRSAESLSDILPSVFRRISSRDLSLPPVSVTSALPSIINGGKDLSLWVGRNDALYQLLHHTTETVFGRDGVGLADCALAESKFEKGEDISAHILSLLPRIEDIQRRGTPDIIFALTGLMVRSQLASGRSDDARHIAERQREHFVQEKLTRFLPNIDALLCRIALHTGNLDAAERWYLEKAPRDPTRLNVMLRYQYLTQAMAELALGRPKSALMTLAPLTPYCETCARHIDLIQIHLISAIALSRQKDEAWREHLSAALRSAGRFNYIRPISVFGAPLLPLLANFQWDCSNKTWRRQLLADVRMISAFYPRFLAPRIPPHCELTETENQVLRLLCADKSNAEIGEVLNIKLSTVKTHVSHILGKLGVKSRSEAKSAARNLHLIPIDL